MTEVQQIPRFENDLAEFVTEMRAQVFNSKLEAARYFNLTRPTISRYESGHITPPLGYLLALAQLSSENIPGNVTPLENYRQKLLQEVNKALRWYYRDKLPFRKPFQSWQELEQGAASYLADRSKEPGEPLLPVPISSTLRHEDWGEAIDAGTFYGREDELELLENWLSGAACRLVALLGIGGIGKTALSIKLANNVKNQFDFVIWRSLRNAPPLDDIVTELIKLLARQTKLDLPEGRDGKISLLIHYLRKFRCLLILDNLETILQGDTRHSNYRENRQGYGELISRVGGTNHQSCLLITSREKIEEISLLEGKASPVRALFLRGVGQLAGRKILEDRGLFGAEANFNKLINLYSGNPLALKLAASTISELFSGDVGAFLREGQIIFGGVERLLEQQFVRLNDLEQTIMYWLAVGREQVALSMLQTGIMPPVAKKAVLEALKSLRERSLIELDNSHSAVLTEKGAAFTQQPVVMEFVTARLIENVTAQLLESNPALLTRYPLTNAQDKDFVQKAQIRLIVRPVLDRLLPIFRDSTRLESHLTAILQNLRQLSRNEQGYAGGNLANLLYHLRGDLRGYDFSGLNIWHAALQNVNLQAANFAGADLTNSTFTEIFDTVHAVAFNPDNTLVATSSASGKVQLWRVADGKALQSFSGHVSAVKTLAFNSEGNLLATGGNDHQVKIWDVASGQCYKTLAEHNGWVWSVAFSPDGKTLASASRDRTVKLWDVKSGQLLKSWHAHDQSARAVVFSPDNRLIATGGGDCLVKIWDMTTGECLKTLAGHQGWVQSVAFSPDSSLLVSGGEDGVVRLWQVASGQVWQALRGHQAWVWKVAFSHDGTTVISASDERLIRLWRVQTGQCFRTLQGHSGSVRSVALSSAGDLLVSGSSDRTIKMWDYNSGQCLKTLQGYSDPVWSVTFNPAGDTVVSSSGDGTVKLWDVANGTIKGILQKRPEIIWSVVFSPDGTLVAGGSDESTVKIWDVASGQCCKILEGHSEWVQAVAFSPDGKLLASASGDRTMRIWEVSTGRCLQVLTGARDWVWSVAFSPDGKLLAGGSQDKTVWLWDVASGNCLKTFDSQNEWVLALAFAPDGKFLVSGGSEDKTIKLWDLASGKCLQSLSGHDGLVWSVAISPDGKLLASSSEDSSVRLWDLTSGECRQILHGHKEWVRAVTFNPTGDLLVSCSEDETMRVWDVASGNCLKVLRSPRPYEELNISGVIGLSPVQKANLKALGALE